MNKLYERYKDMSVEDMSNELIQAAMSGDLEIIKYVLTSPELKQHADIHYEDDYALAYACLSGKMHVIEYLLTSKDLKEHANINGINGEALSWACENGQIEVVKYLISSPELKTHADIHINDDKAFTSAYLNYHYDIINYLIFDLNIPKSEHIERALRERPDEKVEGWFKIRELNEDLNKNLPDNSSVSKKPKL